MVSMKKFFEAFYENLLTGTNSRPTLGLVWSGLVWSGLVWSGLVWSGLVWSGTIIA